MNQQQSAIANLGKISPAELQKLKAWLDHIKPYMFPSVSSYAPGRKELHLRHFVKLRGKDKKVNDEVKAVEPAIAAKYQSQLIEEIGERLLPGFHQGLVLYYPKGAEIKKHADSPAYAKGAASINIIGRATFTMYSWGDSGFAESVEVGDGDCIGFDNKQPHAVAKVPEDRWCVCFFYLKELQQVKPSDQLTLFPTVQTTKTDFLDKQPELSRQENQAVQIRPDNLLGLDGFPFNKPRYRWADAPSWWNPLGEEITEDCGDCVRLAYHGRLIPKSELIKVDPVEAVKKGNYNTCTGEKYLSPLTT